MKIIITQLYSIDYSLLVYLQSKKTFTPKSYNIKDLLTSKDI